MLTELHWKTAQSNINITIVIIVCVFWTNITKFHAV